MLVLTRRLGESIAIDDDIRIVVVQIKGKQVRLGIDAPKSTVIHRQEIYEAVKKKDGETTTQPVSGNGLASGNWEGSGLAQI